MYTFVEFADPGSERSQELATFVSGARVSSHTGERLAPDEPLVVLRDPSTGVEFACSRRYARQHLRGEDMDRYTSAWNGVRAEVKEQRCKCRCVALAHRCIGWYDRLYSIVSSQVVPASERTKMAVLLERARSLGWTPLSKERSVAVSSDHFCGVVEIPPGVPERGTRTWGSYEVTLRRLERRLSSTWAGMVMPS